MKASSIELYIEELVLHGFAPGDRHAIAEAVERELARLFSEQGARPSLAANLASARLNAGSFNVAPNADAGAIGAQVAQALYGGLSR